MPTHSSTSSKTARLQLRERLTVRRRTISKISLMRYNKLSKTSTTYLFQMPLSTSLVSTKTLICSVWTGKVTRVKEMMAQKTPMRTTSQLQRKEAKRAAKEELLILKSDQMVKNASNNEFAEN